MSYLYIRPPYPERYGGLFFRINKYAIFQFIYLKYVLMRLLIMSFFLIPFISIAQDTNELEYSYCTTDSIIVKSEYWDTFNYHLHETLNWDSIIIELDRINACSRVVKNDYDLASTYIWYGYTYGKKREFNSMKDSLDILYNMVDDMDLGIEERYGTLADMYFWLGRYYDYRKWDEEAIKHYLLSMDVLLEQANFEYSDSIDFTTLCSNCSFNLANLFNNLALAYDYLGEYEKSIEYYRITLKINKENLMYAYARKSQGLAYQNLFRAYVQNLQYDKAEETYVEIHKFLPLIKDIRFKNWVESLSYKNMALLYYRKKDYEKTLEYLDKIKDIDLLKDDVKVYTYQTYGQTLSKLGLHQAALDSLFIAKDITSSFWGDYNREMAVCHLRIGEAYLGLGKEDLAIGNYNIALNTLLGLKRDNCNCKEIKINEISDKKLALEILFQKSKLLNDKSELKDCLLKSDELIKVIQFKTLLTDEARYFLNEKTKSIYEFSIDRFQEEAGLAYDFSQYSRSLILLQQIQDKRASDLIDIPEEELLKGENLKLKQNEYLRTREELLVKGELDELSKNNEELFFNDKLYDKWLNDLEKKYPSYYNLKYKLPKISIKDLRKTLASKEATLIEYFLGEENLFIFVINKQGIQSVEKIPVSEQLYDDIKALNAAISTPDNSFEMYKIFYDSSKRLYDLLIGGIKDELTTKNLIIISDEQLNLIPFEVLVSDENSFKDNNPHYHQLNYLVKDYDISYHYSSNLINQKPTKKKGSRKDFLGIAPTFSGRNVSDLENNLSEIANASKYYKDNNTLVELNATYEEVMNAIKDYRMVHFATHAIFNDQIPLDSRIELADTSLYIYEIFGMDHNLDLAIMSACETAAGKQRKGEGVISLARAFIQSGCPSVIASLWSISDQKTSLLMKHFHENLGSGKTAKYSLSEAKRKYINEAMTKNVHPFYWAGFIQIGEESSVSNSLGIPFNYWMIGGVVLLMLLLYFLKRYK